MLVEILGSKVEKVEAVVKIMYKDGSVVHYDPKATQKIIVNPAEIVSIIIAEK